nr:hypothetical protein [Tanacetum cinerariifolium]
MGLDDVEEGEEISRRKKSFIKRAIAYIKIRRQASRLTRNSITRDRAGAHERLVAAFFPITQLTNYDPFFHNNTDCTGREGISMLIKCKSAIRQLAYGVKAVMEIYGPEFLRKPTVTDIEKLYRHHEEKYGFPRMLGSLDCTDWEWFGCPYAFKGQYVRRDHGSNPFILLEAIASQDLWISFVANGVSYPSGYYLVDGIYPKLTPLVKTIPEPADDDHKRIL